MVAIKVSKFSILNKIGDEGGAELFTLLIRNNTLRNLDVSANGFGKLSVEAMGVLLKRNGNKLSSIDVSCNRLGTTIQVVDTKDKSAVGSRVNSAGSKADELEQAHVEPDVSGKILFEAISYNKYITTLDLRVTDIPQEYLVAIQGVVLENGEN